MALTHISKYIALILRHHPEQAGVTLDSAGWAQVDELLAGVNRRYRLTRAQLDEIVRTDSKQRYAYSEDGARIRANQGHSVPVDVGLTQAPPPERLWHGTAERFLPSIRQKGLLPGSRLYVHLSADPETARAVGSRHGRPAVLAVDSGEMARRGFVFLRSANGVWLTARVPPEFLSPDGMKPSPMIWSE